MSTCTHCLKTTADSNTKNFNFDYHKMLFINIQALSIEHFDIPESIDSNSYSSKGFAYSLR